LKPKDPVTFNARDQVQIQFSEAVVSSYATQGFSERSPLLYGSQQESTLLWRWLADRQGLTVTKQTIEIAGAMTERLECTGAEGAVNADALEFYRARGPGAELERLPSKPEANSSAHWSNGSWTLVIVGPVGPQSATPEFLRGSSSIPMALHIWDGLAGEVDLRMAISSWVDIVMRSPVPVWQYGLAAALALAALVGIFLILHWVRRFSSSRTPN
jgi:hypothetical protein